MSDEGASAPVQHQMERLAFGPGRRYEAIEAAIHLNRYLLARPYCAGRRVLDIACGEGYGAYLIAERWNARSVVAVDISDEAIATARDMFASPRIEYVCRQAESLSELFPRPEFDLIVCLETIEHLHDPQRFLSAASAALNPAGVIIVTCPNDHWYYRNPHERNPFHVRKYRFEEFREMSEGVLGAARAYLVGAPVSGFMNLAHLGAAPAPETLGPDALLNADERTVVQTLPGEERVIPENARYFVGIWGPEGMTLPETAAIYPISMDASLEAHRAAQIEGLREEVVHLRTVVFDAEKQAQWRQQRESALEAAVQELRRALEAAEAQRIELERVKRHVELRLAAARAENSYMHEQAFRARRHYDWIEERRGRAEAKISELETFIEGLRRTIADQTVLVDERDAYIRELERRAADLAARPGNRLLRFAKRVARRLLGRGG